VRASSASDPSDVVHVHEHRHGDLVHTHAHAHAAGCDHAAARAHEHGHHELEDQPAPTHGHEHARGGEAGHSHGLVDRSIVRSREGVRTVLISLAVLGVTAGLQAVIYVASGSVALLADLIHNVGDALTAVPLAIAFLLRSARAEQLAGLCVVLAIFVSACVAGYEAVHRLLHPEQLSHLAALALAGVIGFTGNELAARVRLRGGHRLDSPALIADGNHARVDGYVSLSVIASAACVAVGLNRADPLIGLAITVVILKITWDSWRVIRTGSDGSGVP
jgi:Co/Zn/Cd efflux system component